jgi:hypothetical protein
VRAACRATGVHCSTDYRHKREVERFGLEALGVRERRRPCMPNEVGAHLEQRTVAFRLAYPGFGPWRISAAPSTMPLPGRRVEPGALSSL